jgi:excisionase family DNA binding protein
MEIRIIEMLTEMKEMIQGNISDKWMNMKDVCNYTSVSESTIRRAVKRGTLKSSKGTGRLLFKQSNIDNWLKG